MFFFAGGILGLIAIGFWLFALVDAVLAPANSVRYLQKVLWVLIVLLLLDIGAVAWFIWGRPRVGAGGQREIDPQTGEPAAFGGRLLGGPGTTTDAPSRPSRPSRDRRQATRPIAPDDDPEFLKSLNRKPPEDNGPASI